MKKMSLGAIVAAGLLAGSMATSASAADLGGNCCADLEERIAELEATTARKGNRKVSLTISGWVGEQVMWFDDGAESNVYVAGLGSTLATNVKFSGQATIVPGWTAGYLLHLEAIDSDSLTNNQNVPNGPAALTGDNFDVQVLQSYWFLKSDHLGKVSVGRISQASDNTAILVDGSGSLVAANWVSFDVNSFFYTVSGTGVQSPFTVGAGGGCATFGGAHGDCNGVPRQGVRYDSPTFAGFSVSAGWGEDDFWDIAARYSGEHHGIKIAAAVAYTETNDQALTGGPTIHDLEYFQAGLYLEHVATGLWILGNYGDNEANGFVSPIFDGESTTWYIKAGIRQRWNPLGATVLYGEYLNTDAEGSLSVFGVNAPGLDNETDMWGLGAVQEIDAAAMSIWIKYRNWEMDLGPAPGVLNDIDQVSVGALINF